MKHKCCIFGHGLWRCGVMIHSSLLMSLLSLTRTHCLYFNSLPSSCGLTFFCLLVVLELDGFDDQEIVFAWLLILPGLLIRLRKHGNLFSLLRTLLRDALSHSHPLSAPHEVQSLLVPRKVVSKAIRILPTGLIICAIVVPLLTSFQTLATSHICALNLPASCPSVAFL